MVDKITKSELKKPDRFQALLASSFAYLLRHKKKFITGSIAFLVLLIILAGWWYYRYDQEEKALTIYNRATAIYEMALIQKQDLTEPVNQYRNVVNRYPHTKAGTLAWYRLGNIYLKEGKLEEAIPCFQRYIKQAKGDDELLVLAYNALGLCYEQKKDFSHAREAYEHALRLKAGHLFESINYGNLARLYEMMNDKKKAAEYYEKARAKAVDPVMKDWYGRKLSAQYQ